MFHSITTGASNDIEQATKLARAMSDPLPVWSDQFGMVALETVTNQYLWRRHLPRMLTGDSESHR